MSDILRRVIGMMGKGASAALTLTFVDYNMGTGGTSLGAGNSGDIIISLCPFGGTHPSGSTTLGTILPGYSGTAAYVITGSAVSNSAASYQTFLFRFRPSSAITTVTAGTMTDVGNTSAHTIPGVGSTGQNIVIAVGQATTWTGFTGLTTAASPSGAIFQAIAAIKPTPSGNATVTYSTQTYDGQYNTGFQVNVS